MSSHSSGTPTSELLIHDRELKLHLDALGLDSVEGYAAWCARHGFSTRLEKHWHQRCKERYFAAQDAIRGRLAHKKKEKRRPSRIIEQIFDGVADPANLSQPNLVSIFETAKSIEDQRIRAAFQKLVLHAEGRTGLLASGHGGSQFGADGGHPFIGGLLGLGRNRAHWIRPPETWSPRSFNVHRQFSSLARHLLAVYPVPRFLDSVWFRGHSAEAIRQQNWYRLLAGGKSPRSLDLPIPLTKRMAHHFLHAPHDLSVEAALRWGQVLGLGGSARLARAILGSRLGTSFADNDFWATVIQWLIRNPTLNPAQIGPLIDYIYHRKFQSPETDPTEEVDGAKPRGCSHFSIKGRTPASLMRQMREWHARLRKESQKPQLEWPASGIMGFDWTEGDLASNNLRRWTIIELNSRKELYCEGQVMRHCVASYDSWCAFGGTSIWSVGMERNLGRRKRVLTIEVANASMEICQIRGKANRLPNQKEMSIVRRWASQGNLAVADHVRIR